MSYKSEAQRILIGSLNILPPGDKLPEADALELTNFRVDTAGALRSRLGCTPLTLPWSSFISPGNDPLHSMARRGGDYYFGVAKYFFHMGGATPRSSAGDGQPLGMVPMNGYMWVMNRGFQGKDDGHAFSSWLPNAPTSAVTAIDGGVLQGQKGPVGTYVLYCTFVDATGVETNPGPGSAPVTIIAGDLGTITNIPVSSDAAITMRRLYATGGTLGQAYKVAELGDNTTTETSYTLSDADATTLGIAMEIDHDGPPAASGLAGPYFSRLLAYNSAAHPNRLWWTKPTKPYAWPGAAHVADGQWVDVGEDGEVILNVICHARLAVIYKQWSIWRLIGDPDTGTLEQVRPKIPLLGPRGMITAGKVDYVAGSDGVYRFDLDAEHNISYSVSPVFQQVSTFIGDKTIDALDRSQAAAVCMEFFNDTLLFGYGERGAPSTKLLVYHTPSQRWSQYRYNFENGGMRSLLYPTATGDLWGGTSGGALYVLNSGTTDAGGGIFLAYQSRYQDQGQPGTDKVYTNLHIEFEVSGQDSLTVILYYDNGDLRVPVGSLVNQGVTGRQFLSFQLNPAVNPTDLGGQEAMNVSVRLECGTFGAGGCTNPVVIHSIYLDYYVEVTETTAIATIPLDFGSAGVKQVKEVQLSLNNSGGAATARFFSDLPGNAITLRNSLAIEASTGRRNFQRPLGTIVEGRLLNLAVSSAFPFRLYSARLLLRVVGVYVEAYESALGFVWDSQQQNFYHLKRLGPDAYTNPIKRARELEIDIETRGGPVNVALLTDQPGNKLTVRKTTAVDTASDGRKIVRIPLPADKNGVSIEGRLYDLQISGVNGYILYGARVEILPVGVYVEAYEAAAGTVWDSREMDFGTPKVKEATQIELDIETSGPVQVYLYSDVPGLVMAIHYTAPSPGVDTSTSTTGRRKVNLALPAPGVEGRLFRLVIAGTSAFRLYGARLRVRPIGHYIDVDEAVGGALYDSTQLDLGSQSVKQFRLLELELLTYGDVTWGFYTDLPGDSLATARSLGAVNTLALGRRTIQLPLPQGAVPDNYWYGRLLRVTLNGFKAYKLFKARVQYRLVGVYVEAYEAAGGAVWDSGILNSPPDKVFDVLRLELDADGAVNVTMWTDLPGESLAVRFTATIGTGGFGRRFVTMPLPAGTEGRMWKVVVQSAAAFRLYSGAVSMRSIGRYLAAGVNDAYRSIDIDFGSERVKLVGKLECDISTDGPETLVLYSDQPGGIAARYTATVNTHGLRAPVKLRVPGNVRGRLLRVEIGGASSARLYALRAWIRVEGEAKQADWDWAPFPVEPSEALATWTPLPIAETPSQWEWANLPVEPTPPEWSWEKFPVIETAPQWTWAIFPVDDTEDQWKWVDVPLGEVA